MSNNNKKQNFQFKKDLANVHLKEKNVSIWSSRDFKIGLDTIDHYQIAPTKYFYPNTSSLSSICDSLKLKVLKVAVSKNGHHFY